MLNMKKFFVVAMILVFVSSILFVACFFGGPHMSERLFDNDSQISNKDFEQILSVIKSRDEDALGKLFSKEAIENSIDFDESVLQLFDFFQGEVESYDGWRVTTRR